MPICPTLRRLLVIAAAVAASLGPACAVAVPITVPAAYTSASKCGGCHAAPPAATGTYAMPTLGDDSRLGANSSLRLFLRDFVAPASYGVNYKPMNSFGQPVGSGGLSEQDLTDIRQYLLTVRNGAVTLNTVATAGLSGSYTFAAKVTADTTSSATLSIKVANPRAVPA